MAETAQTIYRSQNGDRWQLVRDDVSGRATVRHEANPSSGGHRTELEVEEFLSQAGSGPEFAALRDLLARNAASAKDAGPAPKAKKRAHP
jgi:hypothetical protein